MTHKTITDHNRLDGCLSIAHHPDVFLSEEVTTYFPDGCKIHLLVWNLTEAHHDEIQRLRPNIFELAAYLRAENLPHGVGHPLVNINQVLTVSHVEKLVLLFRVFEGRNGNREPLAQEVCGLCLAALTPEKIAEFANRHNLEPTHANAHRKVLFASSDDHSGVHPGRTFTEVPRAGKLAEFFTGLLAGEATLHGPMGDPLTLSSSLYTTVFSFARDKIKRSRARLRRPDRQDGRALSRRPEPDRLFLRGKIRPHRRGRPHRPGARLREAGRGHAHARNQRLSV